MRKKGQKHTRDPKEDSEECKENQGDLIDIQWEDIETCLNKNNIQIYKLAKNLASKKQGRSTTYQNRSGKCPTEEQEVSADEQNISEQGGYEKKQHSSGLQSAPRRSTINPL